MDRTDMYNDESLPSETSMEEMKDAYREILSPIAREKIGVFLSTSKKHKPTICMPNFESIARLYALEKDIIIALGRLSIRARLISTRRTIDGIIAIKNSILESLERVYIKGRKTAIPYTPHIVDRPSYNALYSEIEGIEANIILTLDSLKLHHLTIREQSAGILILTLKV